MSDLEKTAPAGDHEGLPGDFRCFVPESVTPESAAAARAVMEVLEQFSGRGGPDPTSGADWEAHRAEIEATALRTVAAMPNLPRVPWRAERLGEVEVIRFASDPRPGEARVLIYLHGGAYTLFSARSATVLPSLISQATHLPVVSVEYTLAPAGDPLITTGEVLAVFKALLAQGIAATAIGMFGDSAGGGLAAASVLRMRDEGLPLPGALALLSAWTDITGAGDTNATLRDADPMLDATQLKQAAAAYAAPDKLRSPYASPIYGDYGQGFSPTLIQAGTREQLLSDSVRLYQAISRGGSEAVLDIYEGMPHVFQSVLPGTAEGQQAIGRIADFFARHLLR